MPATPQTPYHRWGIRFTSDSTHDKDYLQIQHDNDPSVAYRGELFLNETLDEIYYSDKNGVIRKLGERSEASVLFDRLDFSSLREFANETAAATDANPVPLGGLYRTGTTPKVRVLDHITSNWEFDGDTASTPSGELIHDGVIISDSGARLGSVTISDELILAEHGNSVPSINGGNVSTPTLIPLDSTSLILSGDVNLDHFSVDGGKEGQVIYLILGSLGAGFYAQDIKILFGDCHYTTVSGQNISRSNGVAIWRPFFDQIGGISVSTIATAIFANGAWNVSSGYVKGYNSPTAISISPTSFDENIAPDSVVATLTSTDPDLNETFTYSLVSGTGDTDNASFAIAGDKLKIISSPDYETQSSYSVRIRTTDSTGLFFEDTFTLTVNDLVGV